MPLYEYECEACRQRFERIQKFSDPLVDTCPSCGGAVRKLLSSPAIQFKGSGFYITDYPKKGSGGDKTDKTDKTESAGGDTTSAKPADKAADKPASSESTPKTPAKDT